MRRDESANDELSGHHSIFKSYVSEWVIEILWVMSPISNFYLDIDCVILSRIVQETIIGKTSTKASTCIRSSLWNNVNNVNLR